MSSIEEQIHAFNPGNLIILYELDLSVLNEDVMRFTSSAEESQAIVFDGEIYVPLPVRASGFDATSVGAAPSPSITVSNVLLAASAAVNTYDDLLGIVLTRTKTFDRFIDSGSEPDPEQIFPTDEYRIERKTDQTDTEITFSLSSILDQQGKMLPGRQMLRTACTHIYRRWNSELQVIDHTLADCPYTGVLAFTAQGVPTDLENDACGKRLRDCECRFEGTEGVGAPLPTWAFPGLSRIL